MSLIETFHHWTKRRDRAHVLLAEPYLYKVCDQCGSAVRQMAPICPACHAYRFNHKVDDLVAACDAMVQTAFPKTSGTVPRIPETIVQSFALKPILTIV